MQLDRLPPPAAPTRSPAGAAAVHPARARDPLPHLPGDDTDVLTLDIARREDVVELAVAGELDASNAARLDEAMAWLRRERDRRGGGTIVVDTRRLRFVDLAGYRAVRRIAAGPGAAPDPGVVCIVGEVVARMQRLLVLATVRASPAARTGTVRPATARPAGSRPAPIPSAPVA